MGLEERENKRKKSIVSSMLSEVSDTSEKVNGSRDISQDMYIVPKAKTETRSKRINLLVAPSVYAEAQKKCGEMGISLNECINQFLNNWVRA